MEDNNLVITSKLRMICIFLAIVFVTNACFSFYIYDKLNTKINTTNTNIEKSEKNLNEKISAIQNAGASGKQEKSIPEGPQDFNLTGMNGTTEKFSAKYSNKTVVAVFFASWCEYCQKEIPIIIKMQKKYESDNLKFIYISVDAKTADLKKYLKDNKMNISPYLDPSAQLVNTLNPNGGIPYIAIFDKSRTISDTYVGARSEDELNKILSGLK